jgi:hypothetical protein
MEEEPILPKKSKIATETHKPHVYVLRDWKEYLGESALIIFSVLLALILTGRQALLLSMMLLLRCLPYCLSING